MDSPWRQGQVVDKKPWSRQEIPGPLVPTLQPGTSGYREEEDLPAVPEVLSRGTGSPSPLLGAGDPTLRRGKDTQDVLYSHFRGC